MRERSCGVERGLVAGLLVLASLACSDGPEACLEQGGSFNLQIGACDFAHAQPGPEAPCLRDIVGKWHVAEEVVPGAVPSSQNQGWTGRRAVYTAHRAIFDNDACGQPSYVSRVVDAAAFEREFRVPPTALGLPDGATCVTDVGCPGEWVSPGSPLIHSSAGLLTNWQGVFMRLERDTGR